MATRCAWIETKKQKKEISPISSWEDKIIPNALELLSYIHINGGIPKDYPFNYYDVVEFVGVNQETGRRYNRDEIFANAGKKFTNYGNEAFQPMDKFEFEDFIASLPEDNQKYEQKAVFTVLVWVNMIEIFPYDKVVEAFLWNYNLSQKMMAGILSSIYRQDKSLDCEHMKRIMKQAGSRCDGNYKNFTKNAAFLFQREYGNSFLVMLKKFLPMCYESLNSGTMRNLKLIKTEERGVLVETEVEN